MNLTQIEYFFVTAKAGSFSLAAKNSYVAQQTLSESVSALEKEWGLPLFERHRGGITLTEFGKAMLPQCEFLLTAAGRIVGFAERYRNSLSSTFTLVYDAACLKPSGSSFSVERIAEVGKDVGDVAFNLFELSSDACLAAVERGTADMAIVVGEPDPSRFLFTRLSTVFFLAVLPADHALAGKDVVSIGDLADLVLFPRPDLGPIYQQIVAGYRKYGIEPRFLGSPIAYTAENTQAFVAQGRGADISPAHFADLPHRNVAYRPLAEEDAIILPIGLAEKLGNKDNPIGAKLKSQILSLVPFHWTDPPQQAPGARAHLR